MNISCPGLRDRRIAAADETRSTRGDDSHVYRNHSVAYLRGAVTRPTPRTRYDREPSAIRAIVLHQTAGNSYLTGYAASTLARPADDGRVSARSRLDRIAAHFVVLQDGTVFYSHDVQYIVDNAAGRLGIDIEVAGSFPSDAVPDPARRGPEAAIRGLRSLVQALQQQLPCITHIHPHGQVQSMEAAVRGHPAIACGGPDSDNPCSKLVSCPGPDIWVNVGRWASGPGGLGLISATPLAPYQNNGIVPGMDNDAYDQRIS